MVSAWIVVKNTILMECVQAKILAAEERIFLSTLYIGRTEDELVNHIRSYAGTRVDVK